MPRSLIHIVGIGDVLSWLDRSRRNLLDHNFLGKVGAYLTFREKQRTQSGKDIDLLPFRKYVPWYADYRRKKGRQAEHVDLTFTGAMLNSLAFRVLSDANHTVEVFFRQHAEAEKALENITTLSRDFHGIDPDAQEVVMQMFEEHLGKALE